MWFYKLALWSNRSFIYLFFLFFLFLFLTLSLLQSKYSYKNIEISVCKILTNKLYFCKGRLTKKIHIFESKHYGSSLADYVSE